ncbi:GNAT family N-acetyltransferase [Halobacterium hubeiense]|uniref:GNAT family N-acetyltransferase n=1 Tax=Halobacterium hubeiense TaxID=1407499 RepID=UPI003C71E579
MAEQEPGARAKYTVRPAEPGDKDGFLDLYEATWGRARSDAWFDWRFRRDPYSPGVEMIVAEGEDGLVGAEPLLLMPLAVDGETVPARQPVDWIVHPDHRRQGVFTRMTEALLSTYADAAAVLFNFPNTELQPGLEKFDWRTVAEQQTRYRIQDLTRAAGPSLGTSTAAQLLSKAGTTALTAALSVSDRLASTPDNVDVERVDGVAASAINEVYAETRPDAIHVPRERAFVAWRFGNPTWETTTYVATRAGRPVATLVVGVEVTATATVANLLDVQPMQTDPDRAGAFAAVLDAALDAIGADADVVRTNATPFASVLRRRGFLSGDSRLLDRFTPATTLAVRPLAASDGGVGDEALDAELFDGDSWALQLGDRDIE